MPVKIFATSYPASPSRKPIEDRWSSKNTDDTAVIVVADGVTQPLSKEGVYPADYAAKAAEICTEVLVRHGDIRACFAKANQEIRAFNESLGLWDITDWSVRDRSCATAAMVRCRTHADSIIGEAASIGDPLIMAFSQGKLSMLTTGNREASLQYGKYLFQPRQGESKSAANQRRLAWQREHVRNNPLAFHPSTGEALGFGVLDGNEDALNFLQVQTFELPADATIIVASDALRIVASQSNTDDPTGYEMLTALIMATNPEQLPEAIIDLIRKKEIETDARSDDATVAVLVRP